MKADVPVIRCTTCDTPYALKFSMRMSGPSEWLYVRDCKHKTPPSGGEDVADVETAPLTVLVKEPLNEQLLEAFGTDDVAALARAFDKGTRSLTDAVSDSQETPTEGREK